MPAKYRTAFCVPDGGMAGRNADGGGFAAGDTVSRATRANSRTGLISKLDMSGQKVRVRVVQKHMANFIPTRLRIRRILADISLRIDHRCCFGAFITDQTGGMCEAGGVVLCRRMARTFEAGWGWMLSVLRSAGRCSCTLRR